MKNIYFNNQNDIDEFIKKHSTRFLGSGLEGRCYLLDDGTVVKVLFKKDKSNNLLKFKDINNPSFIFAKESGYIDDAIVALFMEYVEGENLAKRVPVEQKIVTLGSQLQELVENLKKISQTGILVNDFHCENIMYNENGFKVIDTEGYNINDKNNEKTNIREVMTRIYGMLLYKIIRYEEIRREFIKYGKFEILENPLEHAIELKNLISELTNENIETLDEANKILQKKFKPTGLSKKIQ